MGVGLTGFCAAARIGVGILRARRAKTVFLHRGISLCGTWSWLTHSPKSMLKVLDPLSSLDTLSTGENFGCFRGVR